MPAAVVIPKHWRYCATEDVTWHESAGELCWLCGQPGELSEHPKLFSPMNWSSTAGKSYPP